MGDGPGRLGQMLDERTMTKDLAQLRRYVIWSILPIPVVFAGANMLSTLAAYGPSPVGIVVLACVAVISWASFVLCYWAVDVTADARQAWFARRDWMMLGVGLLAALVGYGAERIWGTERTGEYGSGWPILLALLVAALIMNAPDGRRSRASLLAALLSLLPVIPAALLLDGVWLVLPFGIPFLTLVFWSILWMYGIAKRLDTARKVGAELAVAQERLRFAAELHDIQGHHLQVIALKSELAARLATVDPDTAVGEMREVERLAREALTDTRAVVGGYRDVRLGTELANAVKVLSAAGINARSGLDTERVEVADPAVERLLGLAVREATTNMIRHASPSRARLHLRAEEELIRLVIRNDGSGAAADVHAGVERGGVERGGGGLVTLQGRFAEVGGSLGWEHHGDEFVVTAQVPR